MLNENVMWKNVFKSDETAWIDDLKGDGAFSENDARSVLKNIVDEIALGEIIGMHIQDYSVENGVCECDVARDYFSPVISPTTEVFQVTADDGYDYCNLELFEIDKLVFKKLGKGNGLGVYEILLKTCDDLYTKFELIVKYTAVA